MDRNDPCSTKMPMDSLSLQFKDLNEFLNRLPALIFGALLSSIMATCLFDHVILPDIMKFAHSETVDVYGKVLFGLVAVIFLLMAFMAFSCVFVVLRDASVIGTSSTLNTSKPSAECNC